MRLSLQSLCLVMLVMSHTATALTTKILLSSSLLRPAIKNTLSKLVKESRLSMTTEWSESASQSLASKETLTDAELFKIRENSELTEAELQHALSMEENSWKQKARKARPRVTPAGALYVDVYQESDVLIDYLGEGNQVKKMSFAIVYKYLEINGVVKPHFVRAQLVSTGAEGHRTSQGEFDIDSRHRYYVSQTYGSRMDYAQFFIGGIALHQTDVAAYPKLGMPASHGCVRHHEYDADAMWNLIGDSIEDENLVNIKVYEFGVPVVLADSTLGTEVAGFGTNLNKWLNDSIECTRRENISTCSKSWETW